MKVRSRFLSRAVTAGLVCAVFGGMTACKFTDEAPQLSPSPPQIARELGLSAPSVIPAGLCTAVTVTAETLDRLPAVVMLDTPLTFSGLGSASLFSDSACTTTLTSPKLPAHEGSLTVYLLDSAGEALSLSVSDASGVLTTGTLPVTVTGPANLSVSDGPTFSFGTQYLGTTTSKTFTVSNTGDWEATAISAAALTAPFSFPGGFPGTDGTCGTTLTPGSSCTVVVQFAPTAATLGAQAAALSLSYENGSTTVTATRSIAANSITAASLAVSDGPSYNYGNVSVGLTASHTFTLSNSGQGTAFSIGATLITGTVFTFVGGSYPGAGGTCGSSLAGGASCNIVVQLAPVAPGVVSDSLVVSYNDGLESQTATRLVQGTGLVAAWLSLSDGPTFSFGNQTIGLSTDHVFTLTNGGQVTATSVTAASLSAPFSFKGGSFPGTGGTCTTTLTPGNSCTVVVTFAPTTPATSSATLSLSYNNSVTTQTVSDGLTGTGQTPALLTISDGPTYNFGNVTVSMTADHTFTVTNSGQVPAAAMAGGTLSAPFSFTGGAYPGTGGTCGTTLNAGSTCTVVVHFAPAFAATSSGTALLSYNNGVSAQSASRAIQGTGIAAAILSLSDGPTYNFGTELVGAFASHTFTVTNTGQSQASSMAEGTPALGSPFTFVGGAYPGTNGTCTTTLSSGSSCTVVVQFAPVASGAASASVNVSYFDGHATQTASRAIQGTGQSPAILAISNGPTYNFGNVTVGVSADYAFTVINTGQSTATAVAAGALSAPFSFTGGAYPGTGGTCGTTLNAGSSCTVVVHFAPASAVTSSGTLSLAYYDSLNNQTATRAVTGTGQSPASLSFTESPLYNFGSVTDGSTASHTFTVTNSGQVAATSVSGAALSAPFSYSGGAYPGAGGTCGNTLGASASCTIALVFSPTAAAVSNGTLSVSYNNGATSTSASVPLQGTGLSPGLLSISDGPTYNYGAQFVSTSTDHAFTVTNSGQSNAGSIGAGSPALGAPFSFKGGSYPGTGGTCGATLAASASCSIVVTFSPTTDVVSNDTIRLAYNDTVNNQTATRAVTGTGQKPALLALSGGPAYNYGNQTVGLSTDNTFTITNSGDVSATGVGAGSPALSSPFSFKGGSYPGTGGTCGTTLNAGSSCTVAVTFAPTASGNSSSTLNIAYNNGQAAQTASVGVTGTGQSPAVLTLSDGPTYNFGTVTAGRSSSHTFTVTASGGVPATSMAAGSPSLASPFSFSGGSYPGTGGTCGTTLASGGSCTVVVQFAPVAGGSASGTLNIAYNNGVSGQTASAGVSGTGSAPSGSLDLTFNGTGKVTSSVLSSDDVVTATAVQSDGKIVAAGYSYTGTKYDFALMRFNADGSVDTNFGTSGKVTTAVGSSNDEAFAVVIDGNGRIVVGGYSTVSGTKRFALVRYNSDGSIDTLFGSSGVVTTAIGSAGSTVYALALDGTSLVAAGSTATGSTTSFAAARYTSSGSLDTTFGTTGVITTSVGTTNDVARAVLVDGSGDVYAAGATYTGTKWDFAVVKYTSAGAVDTTYNGGKLSLALGTHDDQGYAAALQSDGKLIVAGSSNNGTSTLFAALRLTTSGALDTAFHSTGTLTFSVGSGNASAQAAALDSNGNLVLAGYSVTGSYNQFTVARVTSTGALDTSFNSTGIVTTAIGSANDTAYAVSVQSDNRIVLGGSTYNGSNLDFALARYWP